MRPLRAVRGPREPAAILFGEHRQLEFNPGGNVVGENRSSKRRRQGITDGHLRMVPLAKLGVSMLLGAVVAGFRRGRAVPDSPQATRSPQTRCLCNPPPEFLQRDFQSREVSFLLLDARTGNLLASRWDDLGQPIPLGSLVKPFIAVAYGDAHQFRYPTHLCKGECRRLLAAARTRRARHSFGYRLFVQFVLSNAHGEYEQRGRNPR